MKVVGIHIYLVGELTDHTLLKHLREKEIAFVAIDQNGKEHFSKSYEFRWRKLPKDTLSREI